MIRKIIHFDLDAFYCAVEEQRHAELKGVPFAVGGRPESRGVVSSCSYAARRFGIRSAMGMAQAVRLCPQLRILPPDMREYGQVSKRVMAILQELTPLVEQLSIDEAFLDVTERSEYATALARRLQAQVEERLGLPSSLGVATNKLVAKIATDVGKRLPSRATTRERSRWCRRSGRRSFWRRCRWTRCGESVRARANGWPRWAFTRSAKSWRRRRMSWRGSSENWAVISTARRRGSTRGR